MLFRSNFTVNFIQTQIQHELETCNAYDKNIDSYISTTQFLLHHLGCSKTPFILDVPWQNYQRSHPSPAVWLNFYAHTLVQAHLIYR